MYRKIFSLSLNVGNPFMFFHENKNCIRTNKKTMNDNKDSNYDPKNVNDEIEIQTSNNKVNNFEKSSKSEIENKDYNFG